MSIDVFASNSEIVLFILYLVITLSFMIAVGFKLTHLKLTGKLFFVLSIFIIILLVSYCIESGYWADEIPHFSSGYVQYQVGLGAETKFLIASCLCNVLALYFKKD